MRTKIRNMYGPEQRRRDAHPSPQQVAAPRALSHQHPKNLLVSYFAEKTGRL